MPATRSKTRHANKHPKKFFEAVSADYAAIPSNYVYDEETQKKLLELIHASKLVVVKVPRSQLHLNPTAPRGYFSSSWDANKGDFKAPRGGFGLPQSVNGSFYDDYTEDSFKFLHTKVEEGTCGLQSEPRSQEHCMTPPNPSLANARHFTQPPYAISPSYCATEQPAPSIVVPTIVVVDVDAVEQCQSRVDSPNAMPDESVQNKTKSSGASRHTAARSITLSNISVHDSSPIFKFGAVEADSQTIDDPMSAYDSGIVLDETVLIDTTFEVALKTSDVHVSQSQDSTYGTQPVKNTGDHFPETYTTTDDSVCSKSTSLSPPPNSSDLSDEGEALRLSKQPRKKLTPKVYATRRSTRLSNMSVNPDPNPAPTPRIVSSVRKHARKANVANNDNDDQEPTPKRMKAFRR